MSKRLVVTGYKKPEFHTLNLRVDTYPEHVAEALGLIPWLDKPTPGFRKPDADLIRKQRIEDES